MIAVPALFETVGSGGWAIGAWPGKTRQACHFFPRHGGGKWSPKRAAAIDAPPMTPCRASQHAGPFKGGCYLDVAALSVHSDGGFPMRGKVSSLDTLALQRRR